MAYPPDSARPCKILVKVWRGGFRYATVRTIQRKENIVNRKVFFMAAVLLVCIAASHAPVAAHAATRPMRVVYGFDREFPPFSYEDPGGKPVGFEVELLEAIFTEQVVLVPRPVQWNLIPLELASGSITITSGMVKTEERAKLFGFAATPTLALQIRLFTKNYNRYPNATFLRGQRVSVEQKSYQHRLLQNFGGINLKTFKDKVSPLKALYNDEVEAYCGPVESAYYYMDKLGYGGISSLGTPLGTAELRFAVNRDRGDVLRMVNTGMQRLMENGEYDRIYRKWFVRDLTAQEGLQLLDAAKEATLAAYTPYSRQTRGAAVLTGTGRYFRGSAVENADTALSVSALTAALVEAVSAGELEIRAAICVDANGKPVEPSMEDLLRLNEFGRGILAATFDAEGLPTAKMVGELIAARQPAPASAPRKER